MFREEVGRAERLAPDRRGGVEERRRSCEVHGIEEAPEAAAPSQATPRPGRGPALVAETADPAQAGIISPRGGTRSKASSRSATRSGFDRKSFIPDSIARFLSSGRTLAVRAMM